jgi:hypothetical protein
MTDPFEAAKRKYARANEHFAELHKKITEYDKAKPYERIVEPDPNNPENNVHKIKLKQLPPPELADITGDMLHNLRSALDVAAHTVAIGSGVANPKFSAFPFAGSLAQMANSLGRSKDIPVPIQSLFVGFQPYPGGDDALWALNEMCVTDKHKMLIPVGNLVVRTAADVRGTGYFSMPEPHVWDKERNEMVLITLGPGAEFNCHFEFHMFVAVSGIRLVDGMPILDTLLHMGHSVENILTVLEFESKRLGYTK